MDCSGVGVAEMGAAAGEAVGGGGGGRIRTRRGEEELGCSIATQWRTQVF